MKRWTTVLVTAAALVLFALPASAQRVLKFSGIWEPGHPGAMTMEFFAERVEQLSNNELEVQVFHSRQLGDALQNVENIRNGSIAFTGVSCSNLSQVDKRMDMWSLPYIFKSKAHYWYVLNNQRSRDFMKPLQDKGIRLLSWIDAGARSFFTKGKLVRSPADLKGMKIRVMASPVMIKTMEAMGASGVPVAWGELYNALQTGVVDGAENNHPSIVNMKFYEVTDYYTLDEHMRIPDTFIMSQRVYERLSKSQQAAIDQASLEAQAYARGAWASAEARDLHTLEGKFEQVLKDVNKDPFQAAVKDLVAEQGKALGTQDMLNWVLQSGKNF